MLDFEHFKTCVRAYFPECSFDWLGDCTVPIGLQTVEDWMDRIRHVDCLPLSTCMDSLDTSGMDEESILLAVLREIRENPTYDGRTLRFSAHIFTYLPDYDVVLLVTGLSIRPKPIYRIP